VGPRACLDDEEKRKFLTLPGLGLWPLGRPARSQSLYRLRYPGSYKKVSGFYFQDISFTHTLVGNSDARIQDFSSARLPTQGMMYPGL
jgi:hypothetical protein